MGISGRNASALIDIASFIGAKVFPLFREMATESEWKELKEGRRGKSGWLCTALVIKVNGDDISVRGRNRGGDGAERGVEQRAETDANDSRRIGVEGGGGASQF